MTALQTVHLIYHLVLMAFAPIMMLLLIAANRSIKL